MLPSLLLATHSSTAANTEVTQAPSQESAPGKLAPAVAAKPVVPPAKPPVTPAAPATARPSPAKPTAANTQVTKPAAGKPAPAKPAATETTQATAAVPSAPDHYIMMRVLDIFSGM